MFTYRNKITGITFTSNCICAGDKWEQIATPASPIKAKEVKKESDPVTPVKTKRTKK